MYSQIYFMTPLILLIALTLDIIFGWPEKIFANIGHPVTWIGKVISYFERSLNKRKYPAVLLKLFGIEPANLIKICHFINKIF